MSENEMEKRYSEAISAIALTQALVRRAIKIVHYAPYWHYVSEPEWARIELNGATAVLRTCSAESGAYYDSGPEFATEAKEFPANLLFISDDELTRWKAEKRAEYEAREVARRAQVVREHEAQERAALAALKAKYEVGHP